MTTWLYWQNCIRNASDGSIILAVAISTKHDSALAGGVADPFINAMYLAYHPFHLALLEKYNLWKAQGGSQHGESITLDQLFRLLPAKAKTWEAVVLAAGFLPGSATYGALFPLRRAPFGTGTQSQKLTAIGSLITALDAFPAFVSLKATVIAANTQLTEANTSQKGSITHTQVLSHDLSLAWEAMCEAQYKNMGSMINQYGNTVATQGGPYFAENLIRSGRQVFFTGHLAAMHTHNVFKHTFQPADMVTLGNESTFPIQFWLSNVNNGAAMGPVFVVAGNSSQLVPAAYFGDLNNTYFVVSNPDAVLEAEWWVEL